MASEEVAIINKLGLHARASAKLTQLASSFPCQITLSRQGRTVNAKSIMGVMMLAANRGSRVIIQAEGERDAEALASLVALIQNRFGEEE